MLKYVLLTLSIIGIPRREDQCIEKELEKFS